MTCDEVLSLRDPCLDSELDAKSTIELEQHLKTCAACAQAFAQAQRLEAVMRAGLNQGAETPALWARIERSVTVATPASHRHHSAPPGPRPRRGPDLLLAIVGRFQSASRSSRGAWASLAAAWLVILALHFSARETVSPLAHQHRVPSTSEMRLALEQKQSLLTDLALASGPLAADKVVTPAPGPRSDRRRQTLNT